MIWWCFVWLQLFVAWPVFSAWPPQDYGRLVDGQQTDIAKYPYQAALLYVGKLTCGGSIIDKKWILTAAHCTYGRPHDLFTIRVGSSSATSNGSLHTIAAVHEHPKFSFSTIDYDIALVELADELPLADKVKAVELADYEPPVRAMGVVSGWGIMAEGIPFPSPVLRAVEVPIVRRLTCNFRYFFKVTDRMLCAGYTFGGRNVCKGDSGGPLVYQGRQVGIVSWASGCARPLSPGVFTNVPNLKDFVRAVTKLEL